jgi:predicted dehydrogenase
MDAMRWLMGETAPLYISAHGGRYVLDHDATINDTDVITFEFASKKIMTYEILETTSSGGLFPYGELEIRVTQGMAFVSESGYQIRPASAGQFQTWRRPFEEETFTNETRLLNDASSADSTTGLIRNFLDCIKSRNSPLCPLEEGHRSTSLAHLANIASMVKERLQWDAANERFVNNEKANALLSYEYRQPWKL